MPANVGRILLLIMVLHVSMLCSFSFSPSGFSSSNEKLRTGFLDALHGRTSHMTRLRSASHQRAYEVQHTRRTTLQCSSTAGEEAGVVEDGQEAGLSRKERRRMNRKMRNRKRNRLSTPGAEGTISRKEELSQNFLEDPTIIERFVDAAEDNSGGGKCLLELGAGLGALTEPLMERYPEMTAVELDGQAAEKLRERLPQLNLIEGSMLDLDFPALAQERGGRLTVVSNAPFGISSSLLFKLLDNAEHISRAVLLLQQEVVNRVLAEPSERKYSTLSVEFFLRAARMQQLFIVPSIAFNPPPRNTKTAVVAVDFAGEMPVDDTEARVLRHTLQAAFKDKGKELQESIWKSRQLKALIPDIREVCGMDYNWLQKRPSELTVGRWLHIARALSAYVEDDVTEEEEDQEEDEEVLEVGGGGEEGKEEEAAGGKE